MKLSQILSHRTKQINQRNKIYAQIQIIKRQHKHNLKFI